MLAERARTWLSRTVACGIVVGGLAGTAVAQTPNPAPPAPAPAPVAGDQYAAQPVAYIHGNIPVTRQDLGEFLIARGGADKLDLLINKKIIEHAAAAKKVTVTATEMEAAVLEDIAGLSIRKEDFIKVVLPRYGKTYYEWMEDVIKPRLILAKLCRDRVKVTEEDLAKQFEREFGEKRQVQIIMWPRGDGRKLVDTTYGQIRTSQDEFDRAARAQANPSLAAAAGNIKPICKHSYAADLIIETTAFKLQPGELSSVLETSQGFVVMKLHRIILADDKTKFADIRPRLEKQAYDERLSQEIPKFFEELKDAAKPNMIFTGPDLWRHLTSPDRKVEPLVQTGGQTPMEKK